MKKHWFTLTGFLYLLSAGAIYGQAPDNMVYNPSFEEYRRCPQKVEALGVMRDVEAWWQPTQGSSDYFNACGGRECVVPRNKMGIQAAHSGDAYCGIYCSQERYREYLQTELKSALVAGKRYRVSFWVSLADKSPHAIATLGALLTQEPLTDSTYGILMNREVTQFGNEASQSIAVYYEPQIVNPLDAPLTNTKEWVEVSGEFTAMGGERFLTIGNFFSFNKSNVVLVQSGNSPLAGAYYYIDDVSLTCIDTPTTPELPAPPVSEGPKEGEVVRVDGIYFATGESEVLPQSYNALIRLKEMLETHPEMKIELRGHTDDQGTAEFNQKLSEERAHAVADFLIGKGIQRRRLSWVGFGESRPIDDNKTAEGRQNNRRVEFLVQEK